MSDNNSNRPLDDQQEPAFSAGVNDGQPVPSNNQGRRHKRNVMAARVPSDVKVADFTRALEASGIQLDLDEPANPGGLKTNTNGALVFGTVGIIKGVFSLIPTTDTTVHPGDSATVDDAMSVRKAFSSIIAPVNGSPHEQINFARRMDENNLIQRVGKDV